MANEIGAFNPRSIVMKFAEFEVAGFATDSTINFSTDQDIGGLGLGLDAVSLLAAANIAVSIDFTLVGSARSNNHVFAIAAARWYANNGLLGGVPGILAGAVALEIPFSLSFGSDFNIFTRAWQFSNVVDLTVPLAANTTERVWRLKYAPEIQDITGTVGIAVPS